MLDALFRHGAFLLAIFAGAIGLILAYRRSKKRVSMRGAPRSFLDYLLIWPLLFESSSTVDRSRRLLTTREVIGWLIVLALIVIGVGFF
jgi:hypothetical protein